MNIKYYDICECCNFKALTRSKFEIHIRSQKHIRNGKSKVESYVCDLCGYWCIHKYNFNVHKIVIHGTNEQKKNRHFIVNIVIKHFFVIYFIISI